DDADLRFLRRAQGQGAHRHAGPGNHEELTSIPFHGKSSTHWIIRFLIAASGSRPTAPPMLSAMFAGRLVAGVMAVTAGWLATYLRKNWAQEFASTSRAHSGTCRPFTRAHSRVRPKGAYTSTAMP